MGSSIGPKLNIESLALNFDPINISCYPGSGTNTFDLSGKNMTGTISSATYGGSGGTVNFFFNGSARIELGNVSVLNYGANPRTMCGWGYLTTTNSNTVIFSYGTNASAQGTGLMQYSGSYGVAIQNVEVFGGGTRELNVWKHLAGVYDGTNMSFYINGVLINGPTAKSNSLVQNVAYIGDQVTGAEKWTGYIGQVLVYNRALSANEILNIYNSTKGRYGLT